MDHRHICLIDTISEKENNPLSSSVVEYVLTFYDVLDSTFIHVRVHIIYFLWNTRDVGCPPRRLNCG